MYKLKYLELGHTLVVIGGFMVIYTITSLLVLLNQSVVATVLAGISIPLLFGLTLFEKDEEA